MSLRQSAAALLLAGLLPSAAVAGGLEAGSRNRSTDTSRFESVHDGFRDVSSLTQSVQAWQGASRTGEATSELLLDFAVDPGVSSGIAALKGRVQLGETFTATSFDASGSDRTDTMLRLVERYTSHELQRDQGREITSFGRVF
jgi:hypothetical protein